MGRQTWSGSRNAGAQSARRAVRAVLATSVVCAVATSSGTDVQAQTFSSATTAERGSGALENPFVIPSVQTLDSGQQRADARVARLRGPEAVRLREESQSKFESLGPRQAAELAGEAFPRLIEHPAGGPPRLAEGARIMGYSSDTAAQVEFPGGKHAVIESLAPIAMETSPHHHAPIDLRLTETAGSFQPTRSPTDVRIPKRLSAGVALPQSGLGLTPVDGGGQPLQGSEGTPHGASVFYADTGPAMDSALRPTTAGFEETTLLRGEESPRELYFHVAVPAGATLVQGTAGAGALEVRDQGQAIASILAPSARDAAGTPVPVSMSASGDVLSLRVEERAGEYQYPIAVDPYIVDYQLIPEGRYLSPWKSESPFDPHALNEGPFYLEAHEYGGTRGYVTDHYNGGIEHGPGQWGDFSYETQGVSQIGEFWAEIYGFAEPYGSESQNVNRMRIGSHSGVIEGENEIPGYFSREDTTVAAEVHGNNQFGGSPNNFADLWSEFTRGGGDGFTTQMSAPEVLITQEALPSVLIDATDEQSRALEPLTDTFQEGLNASTKTWVSPLAENPVFNVEGVDPGLGIYQVSLSAEGEAINGGDPYGGLIGPLGWCAGVQCNEHTALVFNLYKTCAGGVRCSWLSNGLHKLTVYVQNATGGPCGCEGGATVTGTVGIDSTPPEDITVEGLPRGDILGQGRNVFQVSARDALSGVKSIAAAVDGKQLGPPSGSCYIPPGSPCTAKGEWALTGADFGAGEHKLEITATDNAGNVEKKQVSIEILPAASPVALGPGSLEPASGDFDIEAHDVSLGRGLEVSRTYGSRYLLAGGFSGPLGPQWSMSLAAEQSLLKNATGSVTLTDAGGGATTFAPTGNGSFTAPRGDTNLTLSEEGSGASTKFVLRDAAESFATRFTLPAGGSGEIFMPTATEGPLPADTVHYAFKTAEGRTEPTLAVAPEAPGISCSNGDGEAVLVRGCRALEFKYAETTTSGEAPSQWGTYKGLLSTVEFIAWNRSRAEMTHTAVAQYAYDAKGRLRAKWDPRLATPLKTTYGYDSGGHLTALSAPGQEPWLIHYGTTPKDASEGRVLSVTRPPATTALSSAAAPEHSSAPTVAGAYLSDPVPGATLSLQSNGSWSNAPLTYSYQWEDCNAQGQECAPIAGAVNDTYRVQAGDAGRTLELQVSATNAAGTTATSSAPSAMVAPGHFGEGHFVGPAGLAVDSNGHLWVADAGRGQIEEFSASGALLAQIGPSSHPPCDALLCMPMGVAVDASNDIWVADTGHSRIEEFSQSGQLLRQFGSFGSGEGQLEWPTGLAIDSKGRVWVADTGNSRVDVFSEEGHYEREIGSAACSGKPLSLPRGIAIAHSGNVWVSDSGNNRLVELKESGECIRQVGSEGQGAGQFLEPHGVVVNSSEDVFVADAGNARVQELSAEGAYIAQSNPNSPLERPWGLALDPQGHPWASDMGANHQLLEELPIEEAPPPAPTEGYTVHYEVPLGGPGAPRSMGAWEVGRWAQKDLPAQATAIFPPDEPQSYPPSDYRRATIYYFDEKGRAVNVASPGGGISTSEYNATNEATHTLSADNRAKALGEGSRSVEMAEHLQSVSTYNGERTGEAEVPEPGTELLETLGPEHKVKLASRTPKHEAGGEVEAREHTLYYYDEDAPSEGGPYHLVTQVYEGARLASGEEEESRRRTLSSYSGQQNLGWKLRKPTAVTTDPKGLDLLHETVYDAETGNVVETRTPGATHKPANALSYNGQFGAKGTGEGELQEPLEDAVDAQGNVWVTDCAANRVEKFSPAGKFLAAYGPQVPGEGSLSCPHGIAINKTSGTAYISDSANNRVVKLSTSTGSFEGSFGSAGSEAGKFSDPKGVSVEQEGNVWVVDSGNDRVQEFSASGAYKAAYGSKGTGEGEFEGPAGLATLREKVFEEEDTLLYVADSGNNRVQEVLITESGKVSYHEIGSAGSGNGQLSNPQGVAVKNQGVAELQIYVADAGNNRIEEFNYSERKFVASYASTGEGAAQLKDPVGITTEEPFEKTGNLYVVDSENGRVQAWTPPNPAVHEQKTIYYGAAANSSDPQCGEHPEWAELVCRSEPGAQPESPGIPRLPITTVAEYNIWGEPERTEEAFGSETRTKTETYDPAGRLSSSEEKASSGVAVPKIEYQYNPENGALQEQIREEGSDNNETLKSDYNRLGELVEYYDASGNRSTYEHDIDGRLTDLSDGKGSQTYEYDPTSGLLTRVDDSEAGAFTASYDAEGKILSEDYPNGMSANYAYNEAGEATSLEYQKPSCTQNCAIYTDSSVPSIEGQALSEDSSLAEREYSYDAAGRLVQVNETPAGGHCKSRLYAYDVETNRTTVTSREPTSEGKCPTGGGAEEGHLYDEGNRLIDQGVQYDAFGNTTRLPGADAGGQELVSSYYADNQLATQEQEEKELSYSYDPAGRVLKTITKGGGGSTVLSHYAGPGETPAWEEEGTGTWTREISAFGSLVAISRSSETTPMFQLRDLRGDVVGEVQDKEGESTLLNPHNSTEYGVTASGQAPKRGFLGALGLKSELPSSGIMSMGARSYVPQLGRFLQDDPIEGGSANAYTYTFGDPVNSADPSGALTLQRGIAVGALIAGEARSAQTIAENTERIAAEDAAEAGEAEAPAPSEEGEGGEAEEEEGEAVARAAVVPPGFSCALKAYPPFWRGNYEIGGTTMNECYGSGVYYQDSGACLEVENRSGHFGKVECTTNHTYGAGKIPLYVHARCNGTFTWRVHVNGHVVVYGGAYPGLHGAESYSPAKLLRCV
jgi:RHS repeat-associated protein